MTALPPDRPRGPGRARLSDQQSFELEPGLAAAIRQSGEQGGDVVLRGFLAVLARYTGLEKIVVGIEHGGAPMSLRCDFSGDPSLMSLGGRMSDAPACGEPPAQIRFSAGGGDAAGAAFELACGVSEREGAIAVTLAYDGRLFAPSTIRRLGEHLQVLLADGLAHPDRTVARLALLTPGERDRLTGDWTRSERPLDLSRSIVELFEQQADRTPDAVAFVHREAAITLAELRERSEALSRGLIAGGVEPGSLVGVHLQRTLDYPVAMLGVLRAAAACLPLAPDYPTEPLRWIVGDAGPAAIISETAVAGAFGEVPILTPGELERAGRTVAAGGPAADLPGAEPEDLMYVIYTSGSTGRPKGVEVPHRVALNRLAWMWREYPFEPGDVCCQRTAPNFVDSFWELFGPLLRGVPTVIVPARDPLDTVTYAEAFVELAAARGITRTWVVPTILRQILDTYPDLASRLPRLRFWVSIGEAVPAELLLRFEREMPHATLFNVYGASEIWDATWWDPRGHADDLWRVPIGAPIDNVEVRVADRNLELVPVGVPGELLVAGVGLARGYVGRPDLTAEKFVESERLGAPPGTRFYRTGDLVRFLDTGELEYIGRIDRQLQIHGCRVEPAEVEARLLEHDDVAEAAVRDDPSGPTAALVAYVVPASGRSVAAESLRAHMGRVAPWYMLPSAFVTVPSIPLTHSGKVDYRALPALAGTSVTA